MSTTRRADPRQSPEVRAKILAQIIDDMKKGWTDDALRKMLVSAFCYKRGDSRIQALVDEARAQSGVPDPDSIAGDGVALEDFYAYMPTHEYIFIPTREMWPAVSVNSRLFPIPVLEKDGTPALDAKGNPPRPACQCWRGFQFWTWLRQS